MTTFGFPGGGGSGEDGLRHRRSPSGRRILHVEEQRRGAAPRRLLALALLGELPRLFAVFAAHGKWQRPEPLFRDLLAALEAIAVIALLEANERVVDLVQRLRFHLNQRELDIVL